MRGFVTKSSTLIDRDQVALPGQDKNRQSLPVGAKAIDLTTRPIRPTLFLLAMPVLGEQLLNTLVGVVDTYLAGRISATATSAVGLGAYVAWLASLLVMAVGTGTTALVARHAGAGDIIGANRFANQSLILSIGAGILIGILLFVAAPYVADYANFAGESFVIAVEFLRFDAIGHVFLSVTLVGCAALRGVGDTRTPLFVFAVINGVNLLFSWGLVYGVGPLPTCGVRGIVLGTVIAQGVGAMLIVTIFWRGRSGLTFTREYLRPATERIARILRIGVPAAADGAVIWIGQFIFLAIVSRLAAPPLNEIVLAAHVIAIRVEAFTYLPAFAYGIASAAMIGHALGAGDHRRAMKSGYEALLQCGVIALVMACVYYFGAETIYRLMSANPLVHSAGVEPFQALAKMQPILVISIVFIGGLRGAGDTRFPLLISMMGSLLIRLPLGWFFGIHLGWGLMGAWIGMFADMTWRAFAATLRFRSGKWLATRV